MKHCAAVCSIDSVLSPNYFRPLSSPVFLPYAHSMLISRNDCRRRIWSRLSEALNLSLDLDDLQRAGSDDQTTRNRRKKRRSTGP